MILNSTTLGEGPPVLLIHGLFGAARNLGALARSLSPQARVFSLDLRNHGDSPHAPAMDFPTMAADVADTMDALGIETAMIAGHSLGGKTAMALALTQPTRVTRLAVLDIAPVSYRHGYEKYVKAMQAIDLSRGVTRHAADAALAPAVPTATMRAFLLNNLVLTPTPHWRIALDEISAAMPDLMAWSDPPGAQPYHDPTLFLRGGESDYVLPNADATINRLFPQAVCETVEGASHWLHADKPREVIQHLQEFFFP